MCIFFAQGLVGLIVSSGSVAKLNWICTYVSPYGYCVCFVRLLRLFVRLLLVLRPLRGSSVRCCGCGWLLRLFSRLCLRLSSVCSAVAGSCVCCAALASVCVQNGVGPRLFSREEICRYVCFLVSEIKHFTQQVLLKRCYVLTALNSISLVAAPAAVCFVAGGWPRGRRCVVACGVAMNTLAVARVCLTTLCLWEGTCESVCVCVRAYW